MRPQTAPSCPPRCLPSGTRSFCLELPLDQVHHVADVLQFLQLAQGELDLEVPFDRSHKIDMRQRIPVLDVLRVRPAVDHKAGLVKNALENRLKLRKDCVAIHRWFPSSSLLPVLPVRS